MNANKKRIIAVICLLFFIVGIFVACKKDDEKLVTVTSDEDGSIYYTDPTYVIDGIEYGGETHFVKPEETNKNGEYKIGDVTSASYTTDGEGNVAPVTTEPVATVPATSANSGGENNSTSNITTTSGSSTSSSTGTTTSGGDNKTTEKTTEETTEPEEILSTAGIAGVVDDNKLSNDGVINAW